MTRPRVVPVLLCDGEDLVVTRRFAPYRYAGDVLNSLRVFNEKEADEIVVLDISATAQHRVPDPARIAEWAAECFMPMTYGGGIVDCAQAEAVLRAGVERVVLTTAAADYGLIAQLAAACGSQSVLAGIDVRRGAGGATEVLVGSGSGTLDMPLLDHARRLRDAGVGEILLHAIDRDGTMDGYDLDLLRQVVAVVDAPVMLLGGAGGLPDMRAALAAGASAAAAGARFALHGRHDAVLLSYPDAAAIAGLGA